MNKQEASTGSRRANVTVFDPQHRTKAALRHMGHSKCAVYLSAKPVELYPFDEKYLRLLQEGDSATQDHFVRYFNDILRIKLRSRTLSADAIRDVQQETLLRVLVAVRINEVRQPERLGAFVNSTCNNILREYYRSSVKNQSVDLDDVDVADADADLEGNLIANEKVKAVHAVLNRLSSRDSTVLRALLQDRDKEEICRELGVERGYLRVLTHRAIGNFRDLYEAKRVSRRMSQAAKR